MHARPEGHPRWTTPVWLWLLGISILINYVDRGNLAVAGPLLKEELRISNTEIGVLITAFFWTYTAVLAISGWIVDRFDVNWVLLAGFVVWSVATAATGLVHGFALLLTCRMLLGSGESVAFPSYGKIIAHNVPQEHRGVANAMIMSGMSLGPAIGTFACGMAMGHWGWRPVFILIGLVSLLWIVPWMRFMPQNEMGEVRKTVVVSTWEIFRQRNFWAAAAGHLASVYPFYFMIVWLPLYLVHERHFSMQEMAYRAAAYYVAYAVASPVSGWLADKWIRAGGDVSLVRKAGMAVGHSMMVAGIMAAASADARVCLAGLIVMGLGGGVVGPNVYIFAQTLAGPAVAGKWTGLQNCFGNFAGIVVGPLTGWIVDRTGHFGSAFTICGVVTALAGVIWVLAVGRLQETAWVARVADVAVAGQAA